MGEIIPGFDPAPYLQTLGQIYTTREQSKTAKYNTDQTIAANEALQEQEWQKNIEMWNMQNKYNSPFSQQERFKDAGLNPALMYQQGNTGNATTLPKYNAIKKQYNYKPKVDPGMALQKFQDMAMRQVQIDNVKAQTQSTNVKTGINHIMKNVAETELQQKGFNLEKSRGLYPGQLSIQQSNTQQEMVKLNNLRKTGNISSKQFEIMQQELRIKTEHGKWAKDGMTPQDSLIWRQLQNKWGDFMNWFNSGKSKQNWNSLEPWNNED